MIRNVCNLGRAHVAHVGCLLGIDSGRGCDYVDLLPDDLLMRESELNCLLPRVNFGKPGLVEARLFDLECVRCVSLNRVGTAPAVIGGESLIRKPGFRQHDLGSGHRDTVLICDGKLDLRTLRKRARTAHENAEENQLTSSLPARHGFSLGPDTNVYSGFQMIASL